MQKCLRVGKINEPIAKQTKMGWVIMSPVRESDLVSSLYTRILVSDFDRLCDIDVLGVEDNHLGHDENVYKKLKQKLKRNEGEKGRGGGLVNSNNKSGSLGRLKSILKQLQQNPETFKAFHQVIRGQLVNNLTEKVSKNQSGNPKEFFLPHRPVIRQNAGSTKLRVVYDTSAKSEPGYSLNDCLQKKPGHSFKQIVGHSD